MLKVLLICAALAVVDAAVNNKKCSLTGKKLTTFSGTKEVFKFNCKFHAIRNTLCGNYRLTITPGMHMIAKSNKYVHIVDKVWIGAKRLSDDYVLEGRMSRRTAGSYLAGNKSSPYNRKEGKLQPTDVFNFSRSSAKEVTLKEKNGDFTITFQLFDLQKPKTSKLSFECHSATFQPSPFPTQMCGNGTKQEVKNMKKALKLKGNRKPIIPYEVFRFKGLTQTDNDCSRASNYLQNCQIDQLEATSNCWELMYKKKFEKCVMGYEHPQRATHFCVEFACSNYTDPNSCFELKEILQGCPKLTVITKKVADRCGSLDN